jgi:hypothetical protein
VTATDERRAEIWQRAERIRVGIDTVRATREALAQQRAKQTPQDGTASA